MGCAGGKGQTGKEPTPSEAVITVTASDVSNPGSVATASLPTTTSSSSAPTKSGQTTTDDDSEDEEAVVEAPAKRASRSKEEAMEAQLSQLESAANGQEPPDTIEADRGKDDFDRGKDSSGGALTGLEKSAEKPLSKAQQEEAAKMAERRQKFDNKRYQKDQVDAEDWTLMSRPSVVAVCPEADDWTLMSRPSVCQDLGRTSPTSPTSTSRKLNKPMDGDRTPDSHLMGLNHAEGREQPTCEGPPDELFAGLPGGIFDDLEPIQTVPANRRPSKNRNGGFDEDDEDLMNEILQDLEDI